MTEHSHNIEFERPEPRGTIPDIETVNLFSNLSSQEKRTLRIEKILDSP